ncbi:hypothetical protein PR202_ga24635 [Eleusine coracana subsp. coracana]|uniref:F-box domain-containing protein n=1 Tax=Eleusine coracana subsp. coracana TaxID=191504 RepID=A0AAV5D927_ELECO|nr:hypothetical protein PR202_ga24635 [Eleusine coracana subsp. coracana]
MAPQDDLISALPDGVLGHALGFLPAEQAVQTSCLAQRWRHLWRSSMRCLRFVSEGRLESAFDFNMLVYRVLLQRDPILALDEVDFTATTIRYWHDNDVDLDAWIRHVLLCRASILRVRILVAQRLRLDGRTAHTSKYLKRLEIAYVVLDGNTCDFSSCPTLEDVEMAHCGIGTNRILSQSVERLRITDCSFYLDVRTRVWVPNAKVLELDYTSIKVLFLEGIHSLETAVVKPHSLLELCHRRADSGDCCGLCSKCRGDDDCNGRCLHFGGLANAVTLELISGPAMVGMIFHINSESAICSTAIHVLYFCSHASN